jgi:hypothetical protein
MTPDSRADGGWAFNAVKSSQKAYSHLLDHSAPSGKPTNNASHWHFRVSILASTTEAADFTLSVSLVGNGGSDDFNKHAREQLDELSKNLNREWDALEGKIASMNWLKDTVKELNARKASLMEKKAELDSITALANSESDPQEKQRLTDIRNGLAADYKAGAKQYNEDYRKVESDLELHNSLVRRQNAVHDLGVSLKEPYNKKDYARCVAIANGSDIARDLGWVNIGK